MNESRRSRETEKYSLLEAVARERLFKDTVGWDKVSGCCGDL
jgi:hypothetical protein